MTRQRRKSTSPKTTHLKKSSRHLTEQQKFADHISELRRRSLYVGLAFLVGSSLAYVYRKELLALILSPLGDQKLVYLTPGGGFSFIFQISIYAGLLLAAPLVVYHLHAFVRPALPEKAQRSLYWMTLLSSFLIIGGVSYGYFVAIPSAITFLSTFADGAVTPNLTADSYLSFFLAYVGGLALLSLIPLLIMFWHWIKPLTPGGVLKSEQWILLLAFVLAAVITPTPDVVNQLMIAGPVIAIYQIGVVAVLYSIFSSRRSEKRQRSTAIPYVESAPQQIMKPVETTVVVPAPVAARMESSQPVTIKQPSTSVQSYYTKRTLDGVSTIPVARQRPARLQRPVVSVRPTTILPRERTMQPSLGTPRLIRQ